jgi:hypothetical protein
LIQENRKRLIQICEAMDSVITLPFHRRETAKGDDLIKQIYAEFRKLNGQPLIFSSLESLSEVDLKKRVVFLVTGAAGKYFAPEIGETDGPLGTSVLAKTLTRGLGALPVILTDAEQVNSIQLILSSIGLTVTDIKKARRDQELSQYPNSAVVMAFPKEADKAKRKAISLVSLLKPVVAIAIERGGFNSKNHYHTSNGIQVDWKAKMDYIFMHCREKKIPTIGIGDGGNEIGMGKIFPVLSKMHKFGMRCKCPCKSGVVSITETDRTIVGTIANWGAYAISNMIAAYINRRDLIHLPSEEEGLLNTAIKSGLVDAQSGFGIPSVDGVSLEPNLSVVRLLKCLAEQYIDSVS